MKNPIEQISDSDFKEFMSNVAAPDLNERRQSGYFYSSDNSKIYYEYFLNVQEKASIVISHGFCEFTAKFEEVIWRFLQEGYSVFVFDYRGHGYSERMVDDFDKVHVLHYREYISDLSCFVLQIVKKHSLSKKYVLFGHSMGGLIGALYLVKFPGIFSCAVLSSPMMEMNFGKHKEWTVYLLMLYKKIIHKDQDYVKGQGPFDGTSNFEKSSCLSKARYDYIFQKRLDDKNYRTYGASCAWVFASINAVRALKKSANRIKTPILLFQAGRDSVVNPGGQFDFEKKSKKTKLIKISGSKHEIYNADREMINRYYEEIFRFLYQETAVSLQKD